MRIISVFEDSGHPKKGWKYCLTCPTAPSWACRPATSTRSRTSSQMTSSQEENSVVWRIWDAAKPTQTSVQICHWGSHEPLEPTKGQCKELRWEMRATNHVPRASVACPPCTSCHLSMVVLENPSVWVCCLSYVGSSFVLGVGAIEKVDSKEPFNLFGPFRCLLSDTLGLRNLRCHQAEEILMSDLEWDKLTNQTKIHTISQHKICILIWICLSSLHTDWRKNTLFLAYLVCLSNIKRDVLDWARVPLNTSQYCRLFPWFHKLHFHKLQKLKKGTHKGRGSWQPIFVKYWNREWSLETWVGILSQFSSTWKL